MNPLAFVVYLIIGLMIAILLTVLLVLLIRALLKYLKSKEVRQAVSKWESGNSEPSTSNLFAIAKLYGISVEELLK